MSTVSSNATIRAKPVITPETDERFPVGTVDDIVEVLANTQTELHIIVPTTQHGLRAWSAMELEWIRANPGKYNCTWDHAEYTSQGFWLIVPLKVKAGGGVHIPGPKPEKLEGWNPKTKKTGSWCLRGGEDILKDVAFKASMSSVSPPQRHPADKASLIATFGVRVRLTKDKA